METLQQRLRQFRAWSGQTLAAIARGARLPMDTAKSHKFLASFESGEMRAKEYEKYLDDLAHAYGVSQATLSVLLGEESTWRTCAHNGNPAILPRMARYSYRPLPEAAHNLFRDGFVVLDCETTGKDTHQFTQICEITIQDTDGVVLLNSLVNPGFHMPVEAKLIHGITDEMLIDAPTFAQIGPEIARIVNSQVVVIYNAGYDAWLLDRLFIENSIDMPDFQPWCLMLAYADHFKAPGQYGNYAWQSLNVACEQQGVEPDGEAHRSLADTTSTWRLLQKLALQYTGLEV